MPLIMGAYLQVPEKTAAQLKEFGFRSEAHGENDVGSRPVVIVGTESPTDTTTAQFWIDTERLVLVRARVGAAPNQPLLDITGGWLREDW